MTDTDSMSAPEFYVVGLDETEYWDDLIVKGFGRIRGVYLIDRNLHVPVCSLRPSSEAYYLRTETEFGWEDAAERLTSEETEQVILMDRHTSTMEDALCAIENGYFEAERVSYFDTKVLDQAIEAGRAVLRFAPTAEEWERFVQEEHDGDVKKAYAAYLDDAMEAEQGNPTWTPFPA